MAPESGQIGSDAAGTAGDGNATPGCRITTSDLVRVLRGVAVAAKITDENASPVACWLSETSAGTDPAGSFRTLEDWCQAAKDKFLGEDDDSRHIALVTIGIAFLITSGRKHTPVAPEQLDIIWSVVRESLSATSKSNLRWTASRSSQGFLAVPLCSLISAEGNIEELFRLHVWLPDSKRGDPDFAVHSHQPFAQSWILAGVGEDTPYEVQAVESSDEGTHATYALTWTGKGKTDATYKTHQESSTVANTGKFVRAAPMTPTAHSRNMSYSIPSATFHTSAVLPDTLHATFFFFDASRGFFKDAAVLGPKDVESSTQVRDAAGILPSEVVHLVDSLRKWEVFMVQGRYHMIRAEWEHALREFNSALQLCLPDSGQAFPNAKRYECLVHGELGNTYRRFGRYEQAESHLRKAIDGLPVCAERAEFGGEIGVLYRHMGRLHDAMEAFGSQYQEAKELGFERPACRAVGNLGMVKYQLFKEGGDRALLNGAIANLEERVKGARKLKERAQSAKMDEADRKRRMNEAQTWETIGLSRLSLCYAAEGNIKAGVESARRALDLTATSKDTTVLALTRFFYALALLKDGRREEAIKQLDTPQGCTPAIALCKEPSEEHREYLVEVINAGANLDLIDEQGYTALDYAVYSGDTKTQTLILDGLRKQGRTEEQVASQRTESYLRKGYREIFQEQLRPVLIRGGADSIQRLRVQYASELASNKEMARMFDPLKYLRYADFLAYGKLPRSSDSLTQVFWDVRGAEGPEYIIFISYRWLNTASLTVSPDDTNHTQYKRMIAAVEEFLKLHPDVNRERTSLWIDYACVNQEDPSRGISALPMILAQCDAMISLIDDAYYTRAWCSVEVMMVQTLKRSYGLHQWYECVAGTLAGTGSEWVLRPGPMGLVIVMKDKNVAVEADRATTLFLERQARLLGTG